MIKLPLLTPLKHFLSLVPSTSQDAASGLYQRIVAQARLPTFYLDFHISDTVRGRFEMMCLHLFIVLYRLKATKVYEKKKSITLSQHLCDLAVEDFDHSLRDLKITDSTVATSYKKAVEGFYGRLAAYDLAIEDDDPRHLKTAIYRNIYGENTSIAPEIVDGLEIYVRDCLALLATQEINNLTFEESIESDEYHTA